MKIKKSFDCFINRGRKLDNKAHLFVGYFLLFISSMMLCKLCTEPNWGLILRTKLQRFI